MKTYDLICFGELAYEFNFSDTNQIEEKIKQKLKKYKLGPYDQERVNYIRKLKNDLYDEIKKCNKSKYYLKSSGKFSNPNDFDYERLKHDYMKKYPQINENDFVAIINFSIYLYYLR